MLLLFALVFICHPQGGSWIPNPTYRDRYPDDMPSVVLKRRLISESLLENKCSIQECGLTEWCGRPIVLVLDHINGVNNDNRLENLRFLCPNCNSQQDTFCRGSQANQVEATV
jgi:5-methylcytosine-specific restriction endonuclease McrA